MKVGSLATALGVLTRSSGQGSDGAVESLVGGVVGPYEMVEKLGAGGFGAVYRAKHGKTEREVAVKILHAERCTDAAMVERFIDEARTVNKLALPGLVDIFDVGAYQERHYLVMELLRGKSLASLLDECGHLPLVDALPLLRKLAEIVDAIHAAGACHRDLKPANVMLLDDGGVKLIDFGLAKLSVDVDRTVTREAFGTPAYMAPEQCRGFGADARSDRYAFGVIAYRMLTGQLPFEGESLTVALGHVETAPRKPSRVRRLSADVDEAILGLLAKDPASRPLKLASVVDQLGRRRFPVKPIAASVAVLALGGGVAYLAMRDTREPLIDPSTVRVISKREIVVNNIFSIRPDGSAVDFQTSSGPALTIPWNGGPDTEYEGNYVSHFGDGRYVGQTWSEGAFLVANGTRTTLGSGFWPEACGKRNLVATIAGTTLQYMDLASGEVHELTNAVGSWGVRWSPDCDALLWTNHEGVHLTRLFGTSSLLPIEHAGPTKATDGAAFLGRDRVAYCGRRSDEGVELRAHYLDRAEPDTVLLDLGANVQGCTIATSLDGTHVAINVFQTSLSVAIKDRDRQHELFNDPTSTVRVLAFSDEDHVVVGTWPISVSRIAEPPMQAGSFKATTLDEIAVDGSRRPLPQCPGTFAATSYRGVLVWASLEGNAYVLRSRDCAVVATMPRPKAGTWSPPSCAGERCVAAVLDGVHLVAYELVPEAREIGRVPQEPGSRDGEPIPVALLSSDGARIALFRALDPVVYVMSTTSGDVREQRFGRGFDPPVMSVSWMDPKTLLLNANGDLKQVIEKPVASSELGTMSISQLDKADALWTVSPAGRLAIGKITYQNRLWFVEVPR